MTGAVSETVQHETRRSGWQAWEAVVERWAAYVLLGISTVLAAVNPTHGSGARAATVGIAALAAAWVLATYSLVGEERRQRGDLMAVHFAGLLGFFTVLMLRDPIFFVFAISGYLHAARLRPVPLVFAGIGLTSVAIHGITWNIPWTTLAPEHVGAVAAFVVVVLVQTLAIGFGIVGADKLAALSEQRRQTVAHLEATLAENAGLHEQLLTQAREAGVREERQRMAREIHDTLAQGLAGVITQLEAADQSLDDHATISRHLEAAAGLARASLTEARRSVHALRPEVLTQASLPGALTAEAEHWSALHRVAVDTRTTGTPQPLHPEIEGTLLRVVQEALANVARHARASRVGVTLSYLGDEVTLDVRDDGVGFEPAVPGRVVQGRNGFGVAGMRERVERLAGTFEVESAVGAGTAVSVKVPAVGGSDG